jgi:hypothetical protein
MHGKNAEHGGGEADTCLAPHFGREELLFLAIYGELRELVAATVHEPSTGQVVKGIDHIFVNVLENIKTIDADEDKESLAHEKDELIPFQAIF